MVTKKATTTEPEPTANLPQLNLLQVQPYGPGFNYWQLHVTITGITPLLMNNPASMWEPKVILAGSRGKNIPTPEEEAKRGLYVLENDELYFPGLGLRNCVLDGTSRGNFKINKKPLKVPLASALIIPNERLPLTRAGVPFVAVRDAANGYTIDRRRAVIQGQGIIRSRPRLAEGWQIETEILIDAGLYETAAQLLQIWQLFNFAGHTVGIGDYRPSHLGTFGQFRAEFHELNELVALVQ